jgi:hypothetical protein
MRLQEFLEFKIAEDLHLLFNQYINDSDGESDALQWKEKQEHLQYMNLEQLIDENLEYVHKDELAQFLNIYTLEWLNKL